MLGHSYGASLLAILALVPNILASPITSNAGSVLFSSLSKRDDEWVPEIVDCDDKQITQIKESMTDLAGLSTYADGATSNEEHWKKNKGYTHYFKPDDIDKAHSGFNTLMAIRVNKGRDVRWKFRCAKTQAECDGRSKFSSFAVTDSTPEDFEAPDAKPPFKKGIREILLCPLFFTDERTTRHIPRGPKDEDAIKEYCKHKESKKLKDFETGGHTLLHEITHLDTFGIAAGLPEYTVDEDPDKKVPSFKTHATDDWQGRGDAAQARRLKTTKAAFKIETWQNAENFAAAATELFASAESYCDMKEIDL